MTPTLEKWLLRFDALALRERVAVFAGTAAVLVFAAYSLIIEPQTRSIRQHEQSIAASSAELGTLDIQLKGLEQAAANDVDVQNRERLQRAQAQLSELERELAAAQKGLVSAERMPSLLQDVLHQYHGLQLVELRTLPVTSLIEHPAAADDKSGTAPAPPAAVSGSAAPGERNLYKHGFEVTVRGSYPDFVQYLTQLERLPTHMYWGKVTMKADDYPRVTLTATIYTLSLERAWLAV